MDEKGLRRGKYHPLIFYVFMILGALLIGIIIFNSIILPLITGGDIIIVPEITGLTLKAVKKNVKYLEEIGIGLLPPEVISEKREELEKELREAAIEARKLFTECKDGVNVIDKKGNKKKITDLKEARLYHQRWTDTLMNIAKLYGLDNVKIDSFTQINTQHNYGNDAQEISLDEDIVDKIADIIVNNG